MKAGSLIYLLPIENSGSGKKILIIAKNVDLDTNIGFTVKNDKGEVVTWPLSGVDRSDIQNDVITALDIK